MVVMKRKAKTPCGVLQERPQGYPSQSVVHGDEVGNKLHGSDGQLLQDSTQRPAKAQRVAAAPGALASAMPPPRAPSAKGPPEAAVVKKNPQALGVQPSLHLAEQAATPIVASASHALDAPVVPKAVPRGVPFGERDKADLEQWVDSPNVGRVVPFTYIIPCKTPIEGPLALRAQEVGIISEGCQFTRETLLTTCRAAGTPIGLVIDLVSTRKYYNGFDQNDGVEYIKIPVPAKVVPPSNIIETVLDTIDEFISRRPSPNLHVALHCTHGVNRTGFFVGAYLLLRTKEGAELGPVGAIDAFNIARGCNIDKELYQATV